MLTSLIALFIRYMMLRCFISGSNRYSHDPGFHLNRFSSDFLQRDQTIDRNHQLYQMSMSNDIVSHSKLRKRHKVKGQLASADYLAFFPGDGQSELVVSEHKGGRIIAFRNDSKTGQELIAGIKPYGVACLDASRVVLVDENVGGDKSLIKILSIGDDAGPGGSVVAEWSNNSNNWQPRGIAVTKSGQIVVTNIHPDAEERFWIYSADGQESMSFGRAQGPADLVFRSPSYVASDEFGRILASDTDGNCVKTFDSRCRYVAEFGNTTGGGDLATEKDRRLSRPMGLVCDSRGNVIVCDSGNRRLAMFAPDGRFLQTLRQPQKTGLNPVDVAMNSSSDRLVFSVHDRSDGFWKLVSYHYACN